MKQETSQETKALRLIVFILSINFCFNVFYHRQQMEASILQLKVQTSIFEAVKIMIEEQNRQMKKEIKEMEEKIKKHEDANRPTEIRV